MQSLTGNPMTLSWIVILSLDDLAIPVNPNDKAQDQYPKLARAGADNTDAVQAVRH